MESSVINKGGRGHKAPYETTHARIPVALRELVQTLSNEYKLTGTVPSLETKETVENKQPTLTKVEAIALANQILKSKKGAKPCLEKLLAALYSPPVKLD